MARFLFFSIQISDFEEDSCSYPNVLKTHINAQINTHIFEIYTTYTISITLKLHLNYISLPEAPRQSPLVVVLIIHSGGTINIIFHVQLQASCNFSISETEKNRRKGKKNGERRREEK